MMAIDERAGENRAGRRWSWFVASLLWMSAFALGFTKTYDTDGWWHLALGRAIVEGRGFPAHEPLNFPSSGLPFYDPEWLFNVVLYVTYLAGGFAGVTLLKATVAGLSSLILWKTATLRLRSSADRDLQLAMAGVVLFPAVLAVAHRIVERPDLFVMLFLPLTIYALDAYVLEGRRRLLYLLPAVQVLWVNSHPSAVLAAVPFGATLVGGAIQHGVHRWRGWHFPEALSAEQLRTVALVFLGVAGASLLNPYGYRPLLLPIELLQSPFLNQHIDELKAPPLRWFPVFFGMAGLVVLTFAVMARRPRLVSMLLVAPFLYKGLGGTRFVFLFALVAAPVLVRNLTEIAAPIASGRWRQLAIAVPRAAAALGLVASVLTVARVLPLLDARLSPGFGINADFLPEGALRYLDRAGIEGRIYNSFHLGGYIAWRDFPRRTAIVDGRGYLPPGLLEELHYARASGAHLDRLQAKFGFNVAIVDHPILRALPVDAVPPDYDFALPSRQWALVYWDDVALVYLRRTEPLKAVIERDEYRYVKPGSGPGLLTRRLDDPAIARAVELELRRNVSETGSSAGWNLLGVTAFQAGALDEAIAAFQRVQDPRFLPYATLGLATAYWRLGRVPEAFAAYRRRLAMGEDPRLLFDVGVCLIHMGRPREAVAYLERARQGEPLFAPVYPALLDAYRRAELDHREDELARGYTSALAHAKAQEHIARARQLQGKGRFEEAAKELKSAIELAPHNALAVSKLGHVYLLLGRLDEAIAQQRAALRMEPGLSEAHYGLGLAYQRQGQHQLAREHFLAYARLEPMTYVAWQIRQEAPAQSGAPSQ